LCYKVLIGKGVNIKREVHIKVKKGKYSPYKVKDIKEVLVVKQVSKSKLRPAKNYFNRK
jgi:hypothetical protein